MRNIYVFFSLQLLPQLCHWRVQFSSAFIHVSQNANSRNRIRLFMIFKYHFLMYLPGQQSCSPANLTEPELPVTIPKCPAIHFHFLASLASHHTFFRFPSGFFFFFHSNNRKKNGIGCWCSIPDEVLQQESLFQEYFGGIQRKEQKFCPQCCPQVWTWCSLTQQPLKESLQSHGQMWSHNLLV